ncbi:MAG: hypothetical protein LQ351_006640 [Letrouitia transgressa]|nr:MAG: hypothetical protein LQ351_006640 [Letrouitia transgressa]
MPAQYAQSKLRSKATTYQTKYVHKKSPISHLHSFSPDPAVAQSYTSNPPGPRAHNVRHDADLGFVLGCVDHDEAGRKKTLAEDRAAG